MEKHCPDLAHLVPNPDGIDLKKLQEALFTADTCSTAQKERRVFIERIGGIAYQQDCHNHLRCVHTNGMEKKLCARIYKSSSKILLKRLIQNCECLVSTVRTAVPTTNSSASVATTLKGRAKTSPYTSASIIREYVCFTSRAHKVQGKTSL